MKASTVIAVFAATLVSAQLDSIPQCALTCAISSLGSTGCQPTDIACICKASGFITALTPCVQKACSADDLAKTIAAASGLCASAGVSLSLPAATPTASVTVTTTAPPVSSAPVVTMTTTTSSAVYVVPSVSSNTTTTYVIPTPSTNATTGIPTSVLPSVSPTGNAAVRNSVAVGGLGAVLAFAAALL